MSDKAVVTHTFTFITHNFILFFMKQFVLLLCCLYLIVPSSIGQIKDLKEGVLVVRLQSNNRKINALQESIAKAPNESENLKRKLKQAKAEYKQVGKAMMQAFATEYSFSEVVFMHDTASIALKNGQQEGLFLDENLEIIPNQSLDNRFFCLLASGKSESGAEGFKILDAGLEIIPQPFPNFVRLNTLGYLMSNIFSNETAASQRLYNRLAKKLQRQLERYYLKR